MPVTIIVSPVPADATQRGILQTLFASPGYSLLKEMVAARCIEAQSSMANAALYPNNENAVAKAEAMKIRAKDYATCLDILDAIGEKEEEWYTVKLEHRR